MPTDPTTPDGLADQSAAWLASNLADPMWTPAEYQFHGRRLAKAWIEMRSELARRREDEGEPVTEEWLAEIGFKCVEEDTARWDSRPHPKTDDMLTRMGINNSWYYGGDNGDWVDIDPPPTTRGHVRRLLAALGLPTNPGESR